MRKDNKGFNTSRRVFLRNSAAAAAGLTVLPGYVVSYGGRQATFPAVNDNFAPGDRNLRIDCVYPDGVWLQNGGTFYNIKDPPEGYRAAKGDGITDDTDAFKDAYDFIRDMFMAHDNHQDAWHKTPYHIYIPDGTYRITDTILYRGPRVYIDNEMWDVSTIRFIGQSRERTFLKLDDHCPGFQNKNEPKIILAYQHPGTNFNNGVASNELRNITINSGNGNPGAVALQFQGANRTQMYNIRLVSPDGNSRYGIWINKHCIQGYYHDISIEGFDYGMYFPVTYNSEKSRNVSLSHSSWEYITLKNQNQCGIRVDVGGLSVRKLLSVQQKTDVPGLMLDDEGPYVALIESQFINTNSNGPAIKLTNGEKQCLFARNISVSGYGAVISRAGKPEAGNGHLEEYVNYPIVSLRENQEKRSMNLPVEDTPIIPWYDVEREWANVHDYGAFGDGSHDDTGAVQKAFDSGKPVVYFPGKEYHLKRITVPPSVKRIEGMNASFVMDAFEITEASPAPVLFTGVDGPVKSVILNVQRDCIFSFTIRLDYENRQDKPVKLFLENANDSGKTLESLDHFCSKNQVTWARSINTEKPHIPDFIVNGGTMWVFGYKTEHKPVPGFVVKNNGRLEVIGGFTNEVSIPENSDASILVNDNSHISYTGYTNHHDAFKNYVKEIQGGDIHISTKDDYPVRGGRYEDDRFIPLYVSFDPRRI